jgi:hypothetical protein
LERLGSEADIHWIDAQGSPVAISRYKVGDILVSLVRPDGYIGFQTDRLEVSRGRLIAADALAEARF